MSSGGRRAQYRQPITAIFISETLAGTPAFSPPSQPNHYLLDTGLSQCYAYSPSFDDRKSQTASASIRVNVSSMEFRRRRVAPVSADGGRSHASDSIWISESPARPA